MQMVEVGSKKTVVCLLGPALASPSGQISLELSDWSWTQSLHQLSGIKASLPVPGEHHPDSSVCLLRYNDKLGISGQICQSV